MKKSKWLLFIILLGLSFNSNSQQKVTSTAFGKMLKMILSHDVPVMTVADLSIA